MSDEVFIGKEHDSTDNDLQPERDTDVEKWLDTMRQQLFAEWTVLLPFHNDRDSSILMR